MKRRALVVVPTFLLLMALLPFCSVAVWDGCFPLTIVIDSAEPLDQGKLSFAACWGEVEADYALQTGSGGEIPFCRGEIVHENEFTISVRSSGGAGPYGIEYSYQQPKYLIVEYSTRDTMTQRKRFDIPPGRGARTLHVNLP